MEWKQWVHIAFAREGFVCEQQNDVESYTSYKSPDVEQSCQHKQNYAQEFQAVTKLVARLGVVCDGDKSHIQYDLHRKPT